MSVTYLYFIQSRKVKLFETRPIKIGITNDLDDRLDAFHTVDTSLRILGVVKFKTRKQAFKAETELHRRFAHLKSDQGKEWFEPNIRLLFCMLMMGVRPSIFDILYSVWGLLIHGR